MEPPTVKMFGNRTGFSVEKILEVRSETRSVEIDQTLRVLDQPYVRVFLGDSCIAEETEKELAQMCRIALHVIEIGSKKPSIALIGGGTFILPRLLGHLNPVVFELRSLLVKEFCPKGVRCIVGDYRATLTGTYDVIVYDLGGDVPRENLATHLNPGGIILPLE